LCSSLWVRHRGSTRSGIHTAGVCVISRSVAKGSSAFRHIAGVCVLGCSAAKSSSAFRKGLQDYRKRRRIY